MTDADNSPLGLERIAPISEALRARAREKYDTLTTRILAWEDGDYRIEVYHTWVETADGEHLHNVDHTHMDISRQWFESWGRASGGETYRRVSYQQGTGAIDTKQRSTEEFEKIEVGQHAE